MTISEEILENLFDSPIKVRLLKLFLRNPEKDFTVKEAAQRVQGNTRVVKRQIEGLAKIDFLKKKRVKARRSKRQKMKVASGMYFRANPVFEFYSELSNLVLKSSPASKEQLLKKLRKIGRIKLAVISGVFLNSSNSRTDLFIVGQGINQQRLDKFLSDLGSEVGKEICYTVMQTKEFNYRYLMFDRFVRDILEKPHEKLINRLKV